jgi:hypothetical protein
MAVLGRLCCAAAAIQRHLQHCSGDDTLCLVQADGGASEVLKTCTTDDSGKFSFESSVVAGSNYFVRIKEESIKVT